MAKKILKNKPLNIQMSIKFQCPICGFERLISQNTIQKLDEDSFNNNQLFKCPKCLIRMYPITVEVDY